MTEKKPYNPETVKWMSALAYLLFFMPLIVVPDSEKGKFHANQGLTLLIASIAIGIVSGFLGFIPFIGWLGAILGWLGGAACTILAIIGIINALNNEERKLPIIGDYTFLR